MFRTQSLTHTHSNTHKSQCGWPFPALKSWAISMGVSPTKTMTKLSEQSFLLCIYSSLRIFCNLFFLPSPPSYLNWCWSKKLNVISASHLASYFKLARHVQTWNFLLLSIMMTPYVLYNGSTLLLAGFVVRPPASTSVSLGEIQCYLYQRTLIESF